MAQDCFVFLNAHGKKFDEDIRKLTETWRYHQYILGGYGANDGLAEANLNTLKSDLRTLKNNLTDDEISRSSHMAEMDRFLDESQQMFDDLIQSCNDIGTVLSEYGYVKPEDESSTNKMQTGYSANSSLISSDVTDDLLEVEFTPNMTWRHKAKTTVS